MKKKDYSVIKSTRVYYWECPFCGEHSKQSAFSPDYHYYETKEQALENLEFHKSQCEINPDNHTCATCSEWPNRKPIKEAPYHSGEDLRESYLYHCSAAAALCGKTRTCPKYH